MVIAQRHMPVFDCLAIGSKAATVVDAVRFACRVFSTLGCPWSFSSTAATAATVGQQQIRGYTDSVVLSISLTRTSNRVANLIYYN